MIINADDFGMSKAVTDGIIYGMKKGFITSTSLMANMPNSEYAIEQAKKAGITEVGIHCDLCLGKSLTNNPRLCLLTHDHNIDMSSWLDPLAYDEVKAELMAQYKFITERGLKVTHLDNHLMLEDKPVIMQVMIDMARELNIPMRFWEEKDKKNIRSQGVQTPDKIDRSFHRENATVEHLKQIVAESKKFGIVELRCHPGYVDQEVMEMTDLNTDRAIELKVLEEAFNRGVFNDVELVSHNIFQKKTKERTQ